MKLLRPLISPLRATIFPENLGGHLREVNNLEMLWAVFQNYFANQVGTKLRFSK